MLNLWQSDYSLIRLTEVARFLPCVSGFSCHFIYLFIYLLIIYILFTF